MNEATTVLLVEDNADDVLLIRRAFRRLGSAAQIAAVGDGEAAVAYLAGLGEYADRAQHPMPAVVLLDLKLPRKSGLEVLAWLRQQPGLKRLPVVMLTSSNQKVDIDGAYEEGVNSYLVKPLSLDAMQALIARLEPYWLAMNERPSLRASNEA